MRRKRGRAKSSASNPDPQTNGIVSTSPEAGPRRSKRSSSNAPVPSKASRLQPTTPLHMTTRKAASHAATNSTANSDASAESRRSSLNGSTSHVGGFDIDAERPAKRSRLSDRSNASTNERASRNLTPDGKPTTRRLRKEDSFDVPSLNFDGDRGHNGTLSLEPSENDDTTAIRDQGDEEDADVIRDLKPVPTPRRRGRGRRPKIVQQNLSVGSGNESIGQRTPARSASRINGDGMDSDPDRGARMVKRLPGRRRAPNPNLSIEADLRRQLHLKMGYRAVAKALKPVLAELAKRSVDELVTHEEYHMQNEEYDFVNEQLDRLLQRKLAVLENEKNILSEFHERSRKVDSEGARQLFEDYVLSLQDNYLSTAKQAMLNLERDQNEDADSDATEDEGNIPADKGDAIPHTLIKYGVIQPTHNSVSLDRPTGRLDSRFDSRSRVFMETDRHWQRSQHRWRLRAAAAEVVEKDPDQLQTSLLFVNSFGTTDYTRRPRAIARLNVGILAEAADDVEVQAKEEHEEPAAKVIPNEEAKGLQALVSGMELLSTRAPGALQEQPQPLQALPPGPSKGSQQYWHSVPGYGPPIAQHLESQERAVHDMYHGPTYYDPTKPASSSHEESLRYADAVDNLGHGQPFKRGDEIVDHEPPYDSYVRIGALHPKRQSVDGAHPQRHPEIGSAEHHFHEQHTPTPPRWVVPQKQHSRTSSVEEKSSRERSTSFRRHTSPDVGPDPLAGHVKNETSLTPLPQETAVTQSLAPPKGAFTPMHSMEPIPEYQRLGPVAFPGSASAQHGPLQAPGYPSATPAAPQGAIPPPPYQSEPSYHQASEPLQWRSDYDRHEANKARLSHLRPNRPMTIEEEIAALRERHTPHHMKDRKSSGEMRPRSETIAEPQSSKRPSLALDTAAGSESRTRGPSTAPVHASPLATPTQSAGPRQMSPFQLLQRAPPPDGRRESPPNHGHNPRSLSLGGIPLEPPTTPYGYQPPPLQPGYSPYGPPPPPDYGAPPPTNQGHYNANAYVPPPPSALLAGFGSQPPTPSQQGQRPAIFQPILPNNPPNAIMTPTYSGPQYRGTPIQPANPPIISGGPTAPPFGPAFSQIGTTGNGDRPGSGSGGRGGRPRGRGIRTGETVFSHYQGPPGEKNGKFKES